MTASDTTLALYPRHAAGLPHSADTAGPYALAFARDARDLDRVTKLRFEVFNLELREGLTASYGTLRDRDPYDDQCHHMLVIDTRDGEVVGTYRMQTQAMADAGRGFYSADEFDLTPLAGAFLPEAVELGRACVARAHRNSRVLYLLWRGLAAYVLHNRKRYFFGCCSLTSQDPDDGWQALAHLRQRGLMHPAWRVEPREAVRCFAADYRGGERAGRFRLPRLMRMYMDYGARVAGPPAIDRAFKTIDFLALFDMNTISPRAKRLFVE